MSRLSFDEAFAIGRSRGEDPVCKWLLRMGWLVLPSSEFTGRDDDKAPRLFAARACDSLIVPDFLGCKGGRTRWVECKYKTKADLYRKDQTFVTGFSTRHLEHYEKVATLSGLDVHVLFVHEFEREIRRLVVGQHRPHHAYTDRKMGRGGMTFWSYKELDLVGTFNDLDLSITEAA